MEPNVERKLNKDPRNFEPLSDGVLQEHDFGPSAVQDRESWGVMFEHLSSDLSRLLRRESELVRVELGEKIDDVKAAVLPLVLGGVLLAVGGLAAVATAIIALDYFLPLWLSAVIVTGVLLIVGGIMIGSAKKKLEASNLRPDKSIETLGEISTTLKERINEFKHH